MVSKRELRLVVRAMASYNISLLMSEDDIEELRNLIQQKFKLREEINEKVARLAKTLKRDRPRQIQIPTQEEAVAKKVVHVKRGFELRDLQKHLAMANRDQERKQKTMVIDHEEMARKEQELQLQEQAMRQELRQATEAKLNAEAELTQMQQRLISTALECHRQQTLPFFITSTEPKIYWLPARDQGTEHLRIRSSRLREKVLAEARVGLEESKSVLFDTERGKRKAEEATFRLEEWVRCHVELLENYHMTKTEPHICWLPKTPLEQLRIKRRVLGEYKERLVQNLRDQDSK